MNYMKSLLIGTAMATSLAFGANAEGEPNADTVLAIVGEEEIKLGHIVALASRLPDQYRNVEPSALYGGILDQMIEQVVLSQQTGTDPSALKYYLENETRAFLATQRIKELEEEVLTDAAIEARYKDVYGSSEPEEEMRAAHILVETEAEAKALVEMLNAGSDFGELAKEKSTGPSGPNGGDLGWFGKGAMVPEFEAAALGLETGGISAPVQTQFGWHVIKMNERRAVAPPSIEEVRADIELRLVDEAVANNRAEAEQEIKVEKKEIEFDFDLIFNEGLLD